MNLKDVRLRALQRQIARLRRRQIELRATSNRLAWLRLIIFVAALALSAAAWYLVGLWLFVISLAAGLGLFGVAVAWHRRVDSSATHHASWLQLKQAQVARMKLDWENMPGLSWSLPDYDHPFEADLDLTGERSLHRLLDTAVSDEGSQLLRAWLAAPVPDLAEIFRRQNLVRELIPLSLFRGKLILHAVVAAGGQKMWDANRVLAWLKSPPLPASIKTWLILFGLLAGLNLALFALNRLELMPPLWQVTFPLYFAPLLLVTIRLTGDTFEQATAFEAGLQQLKAVFKQLETFSYRHTPHLRELCGPFLQPGRRPSHYLARLTRIVAAAGIRGNIFLWLALNAVVPWDLLVAYRLRQVKEEMVRRAPEWMAAWFELEALCSLANLAYLNPAYILPGFSTGPGQVFAARRLGHPLLPDEQKVTNDFSFNSLGDIAIITGSNMAGKSTFLRTVGVNLALAYAGGPVDATGFQAGLFRLFTCIKVSDSVTNGISYFYAEVKRLKALLAALESENPLPLFFFIDEIFRGTNNRERFIGSQAYVQALVGRHGVGLISTHDLELARLAEQMAQVSNYHFRDDFAGGRMVFDYILRPGPCPTTNALKIMQMEGLPVEPR